MKRKERWEEQSGWSLWMLKMPSNLWNLTIWSFYQRKWSPSTKVPHSTSPRSPSSRYCVLVIPLWIGLTPINSMWYVLYSTLLWDFCKKQSRLRGQQSTSDVRLFATSFCSCPKYLWKQKIEKPTLDFSSTCTLCFFLSLFNFACWH